MANGRIRLDGNEVAGVWVRNGGHAEAMAWPTRKAVNEVDWAEEEGVEADLRKVLAEPFTFGLKVGASNIVALEEFIGELSADKSADKAAGIDDPKACMGGGVTNDYGRIHDLAMPDIGRRFEVRYISHQVTAVTDSIVLATVTMVADKVELPTEVTQVAGWGNGECLIDGVDIRALGGVAVDGLRLSVERQSAMKDVVTATAEDASGQASDRHGLGKRGARDATLGVYIRGTAITFWRDYENVIASLASEGEHQLRVCVGLHDQDCRVYYRSCRVRKYVIGLRNGVESIAAIVDITVRIIR